MRHNPSVLSNVPIINQGRKITTFSSYKRRMQRGRKWPLRLTFTILVAVIKRGFRILGAEGVIKVKSQIRPDSIEGLGPSPSLSPLIVAYTFTDSSLPMPFPGPIPKESPIHSHMTTVHPTPYIKHCRPGEVETFTSPERNKMSRVEKGRERKWSEMWFRVF